jgi:hypothetical protein
MLRFATNLRADDWANGCTYLSPRGVALGRHLAPGHGPHRPVRGVKGAAFEEPDGVVRGQAADNVQGW